MIDRKTAIMIVEDLIDMWSELYPTASPKTTANEIIAALLPQWQDIATAPKDGTGILIYAVSGQYVAYWDDDWWHVENNRDFYPVRGHSPTHWMSLPESPAQ